MIVKSKEGLREASQFFASAVEGMKSDAADTSVSIWNKKTKTKDAREIYSQADAERAYDYPIFFPEDWLAYRAAARLYLGESREAFEDLQELQRILELHRNNYFDSDTGMPLDSNMSREVCDFRFSPMTFNECRYNVLVSMLMVPLTPIPFRNPTSKPRCRFASSCKPRSSLPSLPGCSS
ncbi:MAG: hypothetical protein P4M11_14415 [Candidatus Pacebacteria bacterium]|nr:hypothetical protein [Candidatus Paceibacterota bacterium]